MSKVDRAKWIRVREALLDFAWRDRYTRWYLILVLTGWHAAILYLPGWAIPVVAVWQLVVGWAVDKVQDWNTMQARNEEQDDAAETR